MRSYLQPLFSVCPTLRTNMLSLLMLLVFAWPAIPAMGQYGDKFGEQFGDKFGANDASGANQVVSAPASDEQSPIQVSVEASAQQVTRGAQAVIAVIIDHAEHYHTNLNKPIVPEAMGDFMPVATTVRLPEIEGLSFGGIQWPDPVAVEVLFAGPPISYEVYAGRAVIYVPVTIAPDAALGARSIELTLGYQACDEYICQAPTSKKVSVDIEIVETLSAAATPSSTFDGFDPTQVSDGSGADESVTIERKFLGLVTLPEAGSLAGIIVLAISAAFGGFILNLTPCVLPVIPIKVMTISSHAGESKKRAFMLSIWMAIGVITFWVGIGIPMAFVSSVTDPSKIFGFWWLTAIIGIVIVVMSIGIMGLFQIKLPQKVYMVNPKADTAGGSFVFGIMTAVLGLPCFGFVAGALLAGAATMPPLLVLTIFAFLGMGMAAPYVVLALFPKLIDKLPRTGPASELVKQVLGLLMLAAGAYFLGTSVISYGSGHEWIFPWWGKAVHWWAIGLAGVASGGWLIFQTFRITKRMGPRLVYSVLGLVFVTSGSFIAYNQTMHQYHNFWQPFSPEYLASSLDNGQVVVLDFTAEWCLNCKALEATVLSREPVKSLLLGTDVVPMVADLTSTAAPGWTHLNDELGQTGIPFLAVYAPGLDDPIWVSNAYTSAQVVSAIEDARSRAQRVVASDQ